MSDLALLSADPSVAELAADPGQFVILACERAKEWLAHAVQQGAIEDVVNARSQAEAIRVFTAQKQLGKDAELSAAEIVRRAEAGILSCVNRARERHELIDQRSNLRHSPVDIAASDVDGQPRRPLAEYLGMANQRDASHLLHHLKHDFGEDPTPETVDAAITEAKAEGNLSRANVGRKIHPERPAPLRRGPRAEKPERHRKPDDYHYGKRHLESNRIVDGTVIGALVSDDLLASVNFHELDREKIPGWIDSLSASIRSLQTLLKQLKREINPE